MNLPICGSALAAVLLFMRVKTGTSRLGSPKMQQVDWLGNIIFIPSMLSLLLGVVMAGIQYPWSSWRIILPIVLGVMGWIAFHVQQSLPRTRWPSVPARLFSNRTSACAYLLTFLSAFLVQSVAYFMPVWLQAVRGTSVLQAGIDFLPFAIGTLASAIAGGVFLSKTGSYRPLHAVAFVLSATGFGLFTVLTPSTWRWAVFQLIASGGLGMTQAVMLPAVMAGQSESDVAASAAVYSFVRTFGFIWGVTIPSLIFNASIDRNLSLILSGDVRELMAKGGAYSFASRVHALRGTVGNQQWSELVNVYTRSLNIVWWVGLGVSIVALVTVAWEKDLRLRSELETEYGIDNRREDTAHML
jgi:hypothetical protein